MMERTAEAKALAEPRLEDYAREESAPMGASAMSIQTIYRGSANPQGNSDAGWPAEPAQVKRVAAYCRVSTLLESQISSLEAQIAAFRHKISEREGWKLVDIYADEGISGTSSKNRKEFQRMLNDCEAGKIDYIITKSISRFARNTLECLMYIRHLQSIGVQLLFEKERIDTGSNMSEMILTVLAAFAQEESRSISANLTWGIRKRYEAGEMRWTNRYGFMKDERGNMVINPEEGRVVYRIYDMYEHGMTLPAIRHALNSEGVPSPRSRAWQTCSIRDMLMSEVYMGDIVLQKFISVDYLTHKSIRNDATEVPSYYIANHHPAIVSRRTFERVQKIRGLRNTSNGQIPQYPYGGTDMRCPLCGAQLVQRNTRGNERTRIVLGCFNEDGCGQFAIRRHLLNQAMIRAYNELDVESLRRKAEEGEGLEHREVKGTCAHIDELIKMKTAQPTVESVEFYWLDDHVARVELAYIESKPGDKSAGQCDITVHWRCGLSSSMLVSLGMKCNEPRKVAELYYANAAKYRAIKAARSDGKIGE